MIVARPINITEPDLLIGHEFKPLLVNGLDGEELLVVEAPKTGWTHDLLEAFDYDKHAEYGWDAYLGNSDNWIGGSEV